MLTPPLKASFKPVLKACVYFSSHCSVVLKWPSRAVGLLSFSCCRVSVTAPTTFPCSCTLLCPQTSSLWGPFGVWAMEDCVPPVCEHPAVFHSCIWRGFQGGLGLSCSAQCLHGNKPLWIHYSVPQCLLRDVSLFDFTSGDIYLLQALANLSASLFINWRVHEVDR